MGLPIACCWFIDHWMEEVVKSNQVDIEQAQVEKLAEEILTDKQLVI